MSDSAPTFTADIKPLFRESDREAMRVVFDLWSFDDVSVHSSPIFDAVSAGSMPCDGPWPSHKVELLRCSTRLPARWRRHLAGSRRAPRTRATPGISCERRDR